MNMTTPHSELGRPVRAVNIQHNWADHRLLPRQPDLTMPWDDITDRIASSGLYWGAAHHMHGPPHLRPVFAVWHENALFTTTSATARKTALLSEDPFVAYSTNTADFDLIVEGTATNITTPETMGLIATAYGSKYGWAIKPVDGAFDAPFAAPTAGPPPYLLFRIAPRAVYALGTAENTAHLSTRYDFASQ